MIGFNSLPFGAVGSVAGFLRISQAIWFLGYFGLGLLWSAFYDDYTLLSRAELESSSSWACESLLTLLGMQFATEGRKCLPFSTQFKTLGLEVCTDGFAEGHVLIGHTESRREELHSQLGSFLSEDTMSPKDAERLRGRMIFFEGYTFGRVANAAVKTLGRLCTQPSAPQKLDEASRRSLQFLKQRVLSGPPLKIEQSLHSTWFVFTDGACEPEERAGSIGGVLYNPAGDCLHFFGESVPSEILEDLFSRSQNPIHELELLPILVAALLWGEFFQQSQVVYYVDNESARMACIRGSGETLRAGEIVQSFVEVEAKLQHRVWFGRVPSFSNPSDAPSRLDFQEVLGLGAVRTSVDWEMTRGHLSL
jgi:ribonuclease HI